MIDHATPANRIPRLRRERTWWIPLALAASVWLGWIAVHNVVLLHERLTYAQERICR
jgi:hypothetical protein